MNLTSLKSEFETDPNHYGYVSYWSSGGDEALCGLINQTRSEIHVPANNVDGSVLLRAFAPADIASMTELQLNQLQLITSASGGVSIGATQTLTLISTLFPSLSSASTTAITNLSTRAGSRAEQLFGVGTTIGWDDVVAARKA